MGRLVNWFPEKTGDIELVRDSEGRFLWIFVSKLLTDFSPVY